MKTYKQQTQSILKKVRGKKAQRRAIVFSGCAVVATVLAFVLFLPFPPAQTSISVYADSEYYTVIEKLDSILDQSTNEAPRYKNNFEKWTAALSDLFSPKFGSVNDPSGIAPPTAPTDSTGDAWVEEALPNAPGADDDFGVGMPDGVPGTSGGQQGPSGSQGEGNKPGDENAGAESDNYQETTDNQVQGVIEADLLKRTNTHAFYLSGKTSYVWRDDGYGHYEKTETYTLRVYSITGMQSQEVASLVIEQEEGYALNGTPEMYLSMDGRTLTLIGMCAYDGNAYTMVASMDVGDPANPVEIDRVYVSGRYLSSRMVNGELLLITNYTVRNPDYSDESTFLPQYGGLDEMQSVAPENIVCPENAVSARYTVVTKLDEKSLEIKDSVALLSYSNEVTVSQTNLFLTQSYTKLNELDSMHYEQDAMTEITCISYDGEGLAIEGTVGVYGTVKNQYSMDEYQNVLRVVTTTSKTTGWIYHRQNNSGSYKTYSAGETVTNASLYCIDLSTFEIAAKVEAFAPENETVESVRFDGTKAYVCTAVVVTMTDPVFFFDLSDLQNITYTDTGTIDGYSSSLIQFGHGYLVGIGYDENRNLKIEAYTQGNGEVISTDSIEMVANFSEEYKSYLIDRENGYIGLGVYTKLGENEWGQAYLLVKFEDGKFVDNLIVPHWTEPADVRAFIEEEYLYLFGNDFQVIALAEQQ